MRKQFDQVAEGVERHFDLVAGQLREWTVDSGLMHTRPPSRRLPPPSTLQVVERWISRHRALTAAMVAFIITGSVGAVVYVKSRDMKRRRRAKKSASGARTEVVVVAGAVANPLTSALYLDLERRGFVVYVVASTPEDEQYIRSQSRIDLLPLHLDLVDPFHAQEQLARFTNLLEREHAAFEHAARHRMHFVGLVVCPNTGSAPARVEDISSEEWSDVLNAKVLNIIATTQLLLPSVIEHKAKVLFLTPSVTPALRLPTHAVESTVYGALEGFTNTLATELSQDGVTVSSFRLGHFDIPSVTARQRRDGVSAPRIKATPLRTLHDSVFDALVSSRPRRTWHVGRGSLTYDVIGSWMPLTAISWMMGSTRKTAVVEEVHEESLHGSQGSLTWEKIDQE